MPEHIAFFPIFIPTVGCIVTISVKHFLKELPVRSIAAHVNLSTSHFSRIFRASTGFSPHEYIMLHRIDEAKSLLHSTGLSVSEIAFRVGFRSEVNFIAAFRSKTGQSPTQFRNNLL